MKTAVQLFHQLEKSLKSNSPAILTALGVSGTITTAYLVGRASYDASNVIRDAECYEARENNPMTLKEKVERVWPLYIPAGVSGVATIGCILFASRVSARRTAAITAAYSISEKAFTEYKDKVIEKYGDKKEKEVRDEIAQDRVRNNSSGMIVGGPGKVLCYEMYTDRYFESDMETLRRAENDINAKLLRELWVTLSDFYYILGLPNTSNSSDVGWDSDVLMHLEFSTTMSEDNRPCIAFEYNYIKPLV
jgi:hypothetical protein